ncbi:hypothetical protein GPECTOR_51g683 [Gonium pectorale]|uniref:Glycosyl transferase CAP10 domain-containing protein n=1 Tax=Gonium pectorale TaxID=33097 RepID=A0A150G789_GONPE|nr:hypothetical protein GPECTOR_51g683 [Gonium pectorale]|eukprot:KXZ45698.1 hypothetical protein GPECTOR_51g683 [Gonium pectorale]
MAVLRARYPQHPWHLPVEPIDTWRGRTRTEPPPIPFVRARSDADLTALYDENLDLDLAPWRRRNRTSITVAGLQHWAGGLPFKASQRLMIIKGGRLGILGQSGGSVLRCERPCDPILESLIADLRSWLSSSSPDEQPWPDVAFFINVADTSLCQSWEAAGAEAAVAAEAAEDEEAVAGKSAGQGRQTGFATSGAGAGAGRRLLDDGWDATSGGAGAAGQQARQDRRRRRRGGVSTYGPCPAPILSLIKEWGKRKDEDILVPITVGIKQLARAPLSHFPARHKIDAAVFRGREYCHTRHAPYAPDTCSRTYFAAMSAFNPEWSRFLDVGFVDNYTLRGAPGGGGGEPRTIPAAGFVPTQELARFRYVLALDGITASSRLAQLLSLNSVVLKQVGGWRMTVAMEAAVTVAG